MLHRARCSIQGKEISTMTTPHMQHCHRTAWRSLLAMGAFFISLMSPMGTMAAQATPSPTQAAAATPQVTIDHAMFGPTTLTISAGTTVIWANHDGDLHSVASSQGLFVSPGLDPGDTFSYRFTTQGRIPISAPSIRI